MVDYLTIYYYSFPIRNILILLAVVCRFEFHTESDSDKPNEEKEPLKVLTICYMILLMIDIFGMAALIADTIYTL